MSDMDSEIINTFLDEATDLLVSWEASCLELENNQNPNDLNALFRIAHNIKGSSRAVGLNDVGEFIHIIEDVIVALKDGKEKLSSKKIKMFLEAQSIMQDWFTVLRMEPNYQHDPSEFTKKYFNSEKKFIEEEAVQPVAEAASEVVSEAEAPAQEPTPVQTPVTQLKKNTPQDESLRVSTKKIDGLLNLIGELSIQQSILENSLVSKTHHENESLIFSTINLSRKITKEIYSMAFGLRMTPIGGVFQRLERAIKDLARDIDKDVEVILEGSDVEIEKTILDKLVDPLTHIVRNSIDHGLENKPDRKASGKSSKGQIIISAVKQDDGVEITVKDDGKGLNQKRILEKAIEKNLVKSSQNLTKEEVFSLIFLPGFSTAEKVTNISGRGVGMDVVMKTIEEINGKILVGSEEGRGSKFKIIVPTSMSIVDSLIVSINKDQYVLPINVLEEVIDVNTNELQKNDTVYVYRGQVIPFLHLRDVFGKTAQERNAIIPILVTKVQGKRLAIGVDQIIGQHQSVVRNLSHYFEHSFAISGGTILPSGEPGLILNIPSIMNQYFKYLKSVTEVSA